MAYTNQDDFTLPVHFFERVLGPIKMNAHEWWYTGIDINRQLKPSDVELNNWSPSAQAPAAPFKRTE